MDLEELKKLKGHQIISVIGAGGKTTCIHLLAEAYRREGKKVLVTTTTHMMQEENTKTSAEEILEALRTDGFCFAGTPVVKSGVRKIAALPANVFAEAEKKADFVLVEADGARRMPFKVPKTYEPVIAPGTTQIVLLAGMRAAGKKISEACYNPEGVCRVLSARPDDLLTVPMMAEAYAKTYVRMLKAEYPGIPITLINVRNEEKT